MSKNNAEKSTSKKGYMFKATNEMTHALHLANIKIYPQANSEGKQVIVVENNGVMKPYDKPLKQAEVNEALDKTIIFWYNKLKEAKNGK